MGPLASHQTATALPPLGTFCDESPPGRPVLPSVHGQLPPQPNWHVCDFLGERK